MFGDEASHEPAYLGLQFCHRFDPPFLLDTNCKICIRRSVFNASKQNLRRHKSFPQHTRLPFVARRKHLKIIGARPVSAQDL
jgi:hypothetical protein